MSSLAIAGAQIGAAQAMQQAVAMMKAAVESQQAAVSLLTQAVENGQQLAQSGHLGTRLNLSV